jgi:hypothetical protein
MSVIIPGMNMDHERVSIRPRNVRCTNVSLMYTIYCTQYIYIYIYIYIYTMFFLVYMTASACVCKYIEACSYLFLMTVKKNKYSFDNNVFLLLF